MARYRKCRACKRLFTPDWFEDYCHKCRENGKDPNAGICNRCDGTFDHNSMGNHAVCHSCYHAAKRMEEILMDPDLFPPSQSATATTQKFWLCWNEKKLMNNPTKKHLTLEAAQQEAARLVRLNQGPIHVLELVGTAHLPEVMVEFTPVGANFSHGIPEVATP